MDEAGSREHVRSIRVHHLVEAERRPTNSPNTDHVGVRAEAHVELDDGTMLTATSVGVHGVPREATGRIGQYGRMEERTLRERIRELGMSGGETPPPPGERGHDRARLLAACIDGCEPLFELIDRMAGIDNASWTYDPDLGFRGSRSGTAPSAGQYVRLDEGRIKRGTKFWMHDGTQAALHPLALLHEAENTDERSYAIHLDPMREMERLASATTGRCAPKLDEGLRWRPQEAHWCAFNAIMSGMNVDHFLSREIEPALEGGAAIKALRTAERLIVWLLMATRAIRAIPVPFDTDG